MLLRNKRTVRGKDRLWSSVNTDSILGSVGFGTFPSGFSASSPVCTFLWTPPYPLDILISYSGLYKAFNISSGASQRDKAHLSFSVCPHYFSVPHLFGPKWFHVTLKTDFVSRLIPDSKHRRRKKNSNRLLYFFFAPYMVPYLYRNSESWEVKQRLQPSRFQTTAGQSQPSET